MPTIEPVFIDTATGDLKIVDSDALDFVAYKAGVILSNSWRGLTLNGRRNGSLALSTNGFPVHTVGIVDDTYFNQPVGTHPGSLITSNTLTTELLQAIDSDTSLGGGFTDERIVGWRTSNGSLQELADSDMDIFIDRIIERIWVKEYPSSFRVSETTPAGGTWANFIPNAFSDTRQGATTKQYSVYIKTASSSPPALALEPETNLVKVMYSDTPGGTYDDGLRGLNDTNWGYTIARRVGNKIRSDNGTIGSYRLQTTAPVEPGTWVTRGTITDTKNTTMDVGYIGAGFDADYNVTYVGNYVGLAPFEGLVSYLGAATFIGIFTGAQGGAENYVRLESFVGIAAFVGDYTATYIATFGTPSYAGETITSTPVTVETYTLYCRVS